MEQKSSQNTQSGKNNQKNTTKNDMEKFDKLSKALKDNIKRRKKAKS